MQCCVPFCKSTAEAVSEPTGISFHEFPSEVHLRAAWLRALGTQDNLPDSAVVCSQHFLNDDISETKSGLRQIRTGAIPSTVQVCMICLDTRGKLYLMSKYKLDEAYQNLVGHPLCDQGNLKQTLCVQCAQRLVNFNKFRDKSLRARSLMMELVEQHESITMQHTDIFNNMNIQLKHNIVQTVLKPDYCDLYVNYTDGQTDKTVVKSEASQVSHKPMSVDEDVTEHNVVASNENTEKGLNINLVVPKEEYVSDEEMKETADPLLVMPSMSKDEDDIPLSQIKYEITFECSICSEEFADEDSYNYHMNVHMKENQNLAEDNAETGQPSAKMSTSEMSSNCEIGNTPPDINILPEKSRHLYEKCYEDFVNWQETSNVPKTSLSENVLLVYFEECAKKFQPSTLWTRYSMLRSVLNIKHKIELSTYTKLIAFLKRKSEGFKGKKAKSFTTHEIKKFLDQAPSNYLLMKVALIIGIMGACRRNELYQLKFKELKDIESAIVITIPTTRTKTARTFTITGKFAEFCREYMMLRPKNCNSPYFFLNYVNGKCTTQRVGINKLGSLGKTIASYLKLPNPELYTGHCFRRSSATLLVDAGGDLTDLKRHGRWKSRTS